MTRRHRTLHTRGNIALAIATALGLFLAAGVAAGGWSAMHTWLAVALGVFAGTAYACYALAGRPVAGVSVEGDSPQVTHPSTEASETPSEVRK